eukprot:1575928-Amphidinium_carterae.1
MCCTVRNTRQMLERYRTCDHEPTSCWKHKPKQNQIWHIETAQRTARRFQDISFAKSDHGVSLGEE